MLNDNFEKYEFLVKQEVTRYKELIASKGFLSGAFSLEGYEITHSQKEVYDLYTDQDPPMPYFSYPELIGEVVPSKRSPRGRVCAERTHAFLVFRQPASAMP